MTKITIVAIPESQDNVWRFSSEKVPHLTMLYLGEVSDYDVEKVVGFVEHVAKTTMTPFDLRVEERGTLGEDNADVLFFEKDNYTFPKIIQSRLFMLSDNTIRSYFDNIFQYPEWTPHLTMGYPSSPARDKSTDPKIGWVYFDRVSVWVDDYEGPTFKLKSSDNVGEVVMSEVETMLSHYGIKGMRWGVIRKNPSGAVEVSTNTTPGKKVTATGGQNQPAHPDAIRVATSKQKAKVSTTDSLSTKELQELVNRMNLEQQYSRLTSEKGFFDRLDNDKKKVDKLLATGQTANNVYTFLNSPMGKILSGAIKTKLKR